MKKAFTKGERAWLVGSWDNERTVYYRAVVVYSCGAKQMILTDAKTGQEIGSKFKPVAAVPGETKGQWGFKATFKDMPVEAIEAEAMRMAGELLASEIEKVDFSISKISTSMLAPDYRKANMEMDLVYLKAREAKSLALRTSAPAIVGYNATV